MRGIAACHDGGRDDRLVSVDRHEPDARGGITVGHGFGKQRNARARRDR
jgi:hypothetical protein